MSKLEKALKEKISPHPQNLYNLQNSLKLSKVVYKNRETQGHSELVHQSFDRVKFKIKNTKQIFKKFL